MAADRSRPRTVELPSDVMESIDAAAESIDMATSAFVRAVLAGVMHRGAAESMATYAIEKGLVPQPKRRLRPTLPWESDGENWHYGDWTLVRRGDRQRSERTKQPGDGWFLYGPGMDEPKDLDVMSATKAKDRANDFIRLSQQG